ncbi:MAG: TerB family tellurite resistance protein [Pseudomonadota bacterium]
MLSRLKRQIEQLLATDAGSADNGREQGVRLATATLMAEVARADDVLDTRELATLKTRLQTQFDLNEDTARDVLNDGLDSSEDLVSLQGFTRTLHEALSEHEKSSVIDMLWSVAFADGSLDKYEDALVSQIGELMYVPRSEVLRLKSKHADRVNAAADD